MNFAEITARLSDSINGPLARASMVGICLCAALGACAVALLLRRRIRLKRIRARFGHSAAEQGFTIDETATLWELSRFASNGDRLGILESYAEFRQCVEKARTTAGDDPDTWPDYLRNTPIRPLRRKMMAPPKSQFRLERTTEIEQNQVCRVQLEDGRNFASFVARITTEDLRIALPEDISLWSALTPGASVRVSFWRNHDARYEFSSRIIDAAFGVIFIAHADLVRLQNRKHVRVRYRRPVQIATLAERPRNRSGDRPRASCLDAGLLDISAGGAAFLCEKPLTVGAPLILQVDLPVAPHRIRVPGRILRRTPATSGPNAAHRTVVQFRLPEADKENQLVRVVTQLQQDLIRRVRTSLEGPVRPSRSVTRQAPGEAAGNLRPTQLMTN